MSGRPGLSPGLPGRFVLGAVDLSGMGAPGLRLACSVGRPGRHGRSGPPCPPGRPGPSRPSRPRMARLPCRAAPAALAAPGCPSRPPVRPPDGRWSARWPPMPRRLPSPRPPPVGGLGGGARVRPAGVADFSIDSAGLVPLSAFPLAFFFRPVSSVGWRGFFLLSLFGFRLLTFRPFPTLLAAVPLLLGRRFLDGR